MYEELVKMLRTCAERDSCIGWREACPYLGTGVCDNKAEKAADAIEELQADKAALNGTVTNLLEQIKDLGKPRWIPVTERLPEEMDRPRGEWSAEIRPSDDVLVWLSPEKRQSVAWYSHAYNEWTTVDETPCIASEKSPIGCR